MMESFYGPDQKQEKNSQNRSCNRRKQDSVKKRKRHFSEDGDDPDQGSIKGEELHTDNQQFNGIRVKKKKKKRNINETDEILSELHEPKSEAIHFKNHKSKQKQNSSINAISSQPVKENDFNSSLLSRVCSTSTPFASKDVEKTATNINGEGDSTDCYGNKVQELEPINKNNYEKKSKKKKKKKIELSNNIELDSTIKSSAIKEKETDVSSPGNPQNNSVSQSDSIKKKQKTRNLPDSRTPKDTIKKSLPGDGFTILGKVTAKERGTIKRTLPTWLANPTIIEIDLKQCQAQVNEISELHPILIQKLNANGISHFFPVQFAVIPWLLKNGSRPFRPSDICVSAPTGSGKTLAFVLPIIQMLLNRTVTALRALIMLPVGELAVQVFKVFQNYCQGTGLKVGLIIGQTTFAEEQAGLIRNSITGPQSVVDILVATPGKLVDHLLKTPGFSFKHLKYLVIDEADRMMNEIKEDWLKYVEDNVFSHSSETELDKHAGILINNPVKLPPPVLTAAMALHWHKVPQKLLFSATLSQNPEKLQQLNLFQPKLFTSVIKRKNIEETDEKSSQEKVGDFVGKFTTPAELKEFYIECELPVKPLIVYYLIKKKKFRRVLCFTNSLQTSFRLFQLMKTMGIQAYEYSSHLPIKRRERILQLFQKGKIQMLVCTDTMARGMDIDDVDYVISYDLPNFVKTYIHRVGRTARAGKPGTSISLLTEQQVQTFQYLLRKAGKDNIEQIQLAEAKLMKYEELYREALKQVSSIMKKKKSQHMRKSGQLNNKRFRCHAFKIR